MLCYIYDTSIILGIHLTYHPNIFTNDDIYILNICTSPQWFGHIRGDPDQWLSSPCHMCNSLRLSRMTNSDVITTLSHKRYSCLSVLRGSYDIVLNRIESYGIVSYSSVSYCIIRYRVVSYGIVYVSVLSRRQLFITFTHYYTQLYRYHP